MEPEPIREHFRPHTRNQESNDNPLADLVHQPVEVKMFRKSLFILTLFIGCACFSACQSGQASPTPAANMANPASVFCEQNGGKLDLRQDANGGTAGVCVFPDGSECDEWAYFRGECAPGGAVVPTSAPTAEPTDQQPAAIQTALPIDPADYQGWWTYTHPVHGFSILLPPDWVVEEVTSSDPLMNGHTLSLHPDYATGMENIRMTFRRVGEDVLLWPTGVGQGEFVPQGTLDVAGQPAQRILLVCPTGEITSIWYHQADGQPNISRGGLEFGFIFSAGGHCEAGISLAGKLQRLGEMIIASLQVP
jgi:putative hemolysin